MMMKIKKVSISDYVIREHQKEFPNMYIFYRPVGSKLFRIELSKFEVKDAPILDDLLELCIIRKEFAFVHQDKYFGVMDELFERGHENVMFAEPDVKFWN